MTLSIRPSVFLLLFNQLENITVALFFRCLNCEGSVAPCCTTVASGEAKTGQASVAVYLIRTTVGAALQTNIRDATKRTFEPGGLNL